MKRSFRVRGKLEEVAVLWFVNRSAEPGGYALDDAFSREEAQRLVRLLQNKELECRIQEIPPGPAGVEDSPVWNLIGRLVELDQTDAARLPFSVVACLEL